MNQVDIKPGRIYAGSAGDIRRVIFFRNGDIYYDDGAGSRGSYQAPNDFAKWAVREVMERLEPAPLVPVAVIIDRPMMKRQPTHFATSRIVS